MKAFPLALCIVTILFAALAAQAYEFQPIGFESIGMGGAGVASASGAYAGYYNPALLTKHPYSVEVSLSGGTGIREYNLADNIDKLHDVDLDQIFDDILNNAVTEEDEANITTTLEVLTAMSGGQNGLFLMPTVSLGVQAQNIGFGVFGIADGSARAIIDPDHLRMIVHDTETDTYLEYTSGTVVESNADDYADYSLEYAIDNDLNYLRLDGMALAEAPVSYARKFDLPLGAISIGGSLKYMEAMTYAGRTRIDTESGEIQDQLDDNKKTSSALGVDVGLLLQPTAMPNLTFGLVAKNVNSPKFKSPVDDSDVKVKPMLRAGVAMALLNNTMDLAVDYDLTKNANSADTESQYLGGGVNFHPSSWLSVRAGAMQNVADSNEGTSLTAGLGFGLKWLQLDIAGVMSTKKGHFEGNSIPRYTRLNVSLVSRW